MIITLTDWQLAGYYPFTPLLAQSAEIGMGSGCVTPPIPAKVPGSIYRDLMQAGIIADPYYERNSILCEWVKDRFWVYRTTFLADAERKGERFFLCLEGIDYHAHIFLNGKKLGEHENMFVPFECDVTELILFGEENEVRVILEAAPDEMGQIGYTDRTHTQKARFTYKWDFCTRLVGMGLWRPASIRSYCGARILETEALWENGVLTYTAKLDGKGKVTFLLSHNRRVIADDERMVTDGTYRIALPIENPALWYPNGCGEQPLYEIDLIVSENDTISDQKKERVGLRSLEYVRCDGAREDSLPYIPIVNGKKVFIKGVNCVPIDLMTGCETREKRREMLTLIRDMGCNLIRVWGGGVIECEEFYDLCDEYGLMIWQEMPQSSSGISNVPSKDPHFLTLLKQTAIFAATNRRNHPSLTFFSGGNELMDENGVPSNYEDSNIAMLRETLTAICPSILMLPTSASGPTEYGLPNPEDNHDVHGPWKYAGVEGQYTLFNNSPIQLHSEFGVDGMTNYARLASFLAPENRAKIETVGNNLTWRHHGEWWDTYGYRDEPIFGDMDGDLATFVTVSQYMQAEGLRYALEANRRRQWRCGGSIVWQFNEPWPNVSGTNLVDYEMEPKMAYYFCRDALKSFHASLRYNKLVWTEGEVFEGEVFLHDDTASIPCTRAAEMGDGVKMTVTILDEHRIPAASVEGGSFSFAIDRLGQSFRVRIEISDGDRHDENEYLFFVVSKESPKASVEALKTFVKQYRAKNI